MLKGRIYNLIKTYLEEYMFGFDEKQLETNFWNGNINLKNLNLRPDKISELMGEHAPYGLKAGLISNLKVKVSPLLL
jgi:vacuolar protein sorting-associated protein 13A/C